MLAFGIIMLFVAAVLAVVGFTVCFILIARVQKSTTDRSEL